MIVDDLYRNMYFCCRVFIARRSVFNSGFSYGRGDELFPVLLIATNKKCHNVLISTHKNRGNFFLELENRIIGD